MKGSYHFFDGLDEQAWIDKDAKGNEIGDETKSALELAKVCFECSLVGRIDRKNNLLREAIK